MASTWFIGPMAASKIEGLIYIDASVAVREGVWVNFIKK
jgi:hypothetical protein